MIRYAYLKIFITEIQNKQKLGRDRGRREGERFTAHKMYKFAKNCKQDTK